MQNIIDKLVLELVLKHANLRHQPSKCYNFSKQVVHVTIGLFIFYLSI